MVEFASANELSACARKVALLGIMSLERWNRRRRARLSLFLWSLQLLPSSLTIEVEAKESDESPPTTTDSEELASLSSSDGPSAFTLSRIA